MSRFGSRPIPSTMINKALQRAIVVFVFAAITGLPNSDAYKVQEVILRPRNFSMPCEPRWVPACVTCDDRDMTFPTFCYYYSYLANGDDDCKFKHFGHCKTQCKRQKCSTEKKPLCARCGIEKLSFRNQCELNNFNCLYGNSCFDPEKGYCLNSKNKIIPQKFFEKSQVSKSIQAKPDLFAVDVTQAKLGVKEAL